MSAPTRSLPNRAAAAGPRVLVAHEPRAYREALAAALAALRPAAKVVVVAPGDLDAEVARRGAALVFCSRLSEPVRARSRAWALLYPDGKREVETSVAGERAVVPDLGLEAALALFDRAARLVEAGARCPAGREARGLASAHAHELGGPDLGRG